jgi:hypothetical protein
MSPYASLGMIDFRADDFMRVSQLEKLGSLLPSEESSVKLRFVQPDGLLGVELDIRGMKAREAGLEPATF